LPTYEYRCDSCAKNFDVVQSFQDDPLTSCPTCGSPVRKVFGNVGIVFKGSGFYKTDSRSGGSKKDGGGDGASATNGSEGSSTDGDAKPAASDGAAPTKAPASDSSSPPSSPPASKPSTAPANAPTKPSQGAPSGTGS
jgi:putative FmdB family regulatory protein